MVSMGMLAWFTVNRGPETAVVAGVERIESVTEIREVPNQNIVLIADNEPPIKGKSAFTAAIAGKPQVKDNTIAESTVIPVSMTRVTDDEQLMPDLVLRSVGRRDTPKGMAVAVPGYSGETAPLFLVDVDMKESKVSKWRVGAGVSPTYLSSNLRAANRNISEMVSNESATLSYTGGVAVSFSVGKRLALQTGIYYSSLGREVSGIASYSGFSAIAGSKSDKVFGVETTTGRVNTTNRDIFLADQAGDRIQSIYTADNFDPLKSDLTPFGTKLQQSYEYLEIPLLLSYRVIDRRIGLNITGGLSYNFLLDNRTYAIGENNKVPVGSTADMSALLLSSALGVNLDYSLTDKFSVNMGPSIRYFLNSNGRLTADNPYTFGIWSGVFYKF